MKKNTFCIYLILLLIVQTTTYTHKTDVTYLTKIRNGIFTENAHSAACVLTALSTSAVGYGFRSIASRPIDGLVFGASLLSALTIVAVRYSPLGKRTDLAIIKQRNKLTKEITELTENGTLSAEQIIEKINSYFVTDINYMSMRSVMYLQKIIFHATWLNEKLSIIQEETIPYIELLKEALKISLKTPVFIAQQKKWEKSRWVPYVLRNLGSYLFYTVCGVSVLMAFDQINQFMRYTFR